MKKLSILLITIFFSSLLLAAESRVALVIGNSNYDVGELPTSQDNATDVKKALEELGFEVISLYNGNHKQTRDIINDFRERMKYSDVSLFYYSGFAMQSDGIDYIIPTGADIRKEEHLKSSAINISDILKNEKSNSIQDGNNIKIVIFDASYETPFEKQSNIQSRGLSKIDINNIDNAIVVYSAEPNKVANISDSKYSFFTESLLENIFSNQEIHKMFDNVVEEVLNKTNQTQRPYIDSTIKDGFYIASGRENITKESEDDINNEITQKDDIIDNTPKKFDFTINFNPNLAILGIEATNILDEIVEIISKNPNANILISGYSAPFYSKKARVGISRKRAYACYDYIKNSYKIDMNRVRVEYFGSEKRGERIATVEIFIDNESILEF